MLEKLISTLTVPKKITELSELMGKICFDDSKILEGVDAVLHQTFLDLMRHGSKDEFKSFITILTKLSLRAGERFASFAQRWKHLNELSQMVFNSLNPEMAKRLVESRKYGKEIMKVLEEGAIRSGDLAEKLGISGEHLAKILREFEKEQLIERVRVRKASWIMIGLVGTQIIKDLIHVLPMEDSISKQPIEISLERYKRDIALELVNEIRLFEDSRSYPGERRITKKSEEEIMEEVSAV